MVNGTLKITHERPAKWIVNAYFIHMLIYHGIMWRGERLGGGSQGELTNKYRIDPLHAPLPGQSQ